MLTMEERQTQVRQAREQVAEVFRAAAVKGIAQVDGILIGHTARGVLGYCAIGVFRYCPELIPVPWAGTDLLQCAFYNEKSYRCPVEGCDEKYNGSMILAHLNNRTPSFNTTVPGHGFDWLTIAKYVPLIEEAA